MKPNVTAVYIPNFVDPCWFAEVMGCPDIFIPGRYDSRETAVKGGELFFEDKVLLLRKIKDKRLITLADLS